MGATDDDADSGIAKLFGALRARRLAILLAVAAAGFAAYGIAALTPPPYKGEASIPIESRNGPAGDAGPSQNSDGAARLRPEIAKLRRKVSEAESKVAAYRSRTGPLAAGSSDTPVSRQLADMASELGRVRAEKNDAETRASSVRAALKEGRGADTLVNVAASPLVQQLRRQEIAAQAELAGLSTTLGSRHPRILALQAQIGELRQRIMAESRKVLGNLEDESDAASRREQELSGQMEKLRASSGDAGDETAELQALQRSASTARAQLNAYLARYGEAGSGGAHNALPADTRIVSGAVPPTRPHFPKTILIVIGAMLAAFLLSCVVVMLRELFSRRRPRPVDLPAADMDSGYAEGHDLTPLLHDDASVTAAPTTSKAARNRPVESDNAAERVLEYSPPPDAQDATSASCRGDAIPAGTVARPMAEDDFSIAATAAQLIDGDSAVVICVSPEGDEGSAASVILARLLAGQDLRTVLVDMTGSACPTHLMAGHDELAGIADLLSGRIGFAEAIHGDRLSPAHIVPRGLADSKNAMRAAERLPIVLDGLGDAYDIVLVECGPTDTATVGRLVRGGTRHRLIVTAVEPGADAITDGLSEFYGAGYEDLIVMLAGAPVSKGENKAFAA